MSTPALSNVIQTDAFGDTSGVVLYPAVIATSYAPTTTNGTTTTTLANSRVVQPVTYIAVAPVAGSYTAKLSLDVTYHRPGDLVYVKYTAPSGTAPTVEFRNASATGTLLLTATPPPSTVGYASFIFGGTAWALLDQHLINTTTYGADTGATSVVSNYTADGAIALTAGVHTIAKTSAAAMTVAAPASINGTRLTIISNTDYAHVITFTGATLLDGTTGANLTVTMTAFKGSAITVIAVGTIWLLQSSSNVTSITV